jgi:hypothetical protein
MDDDDDDDDDDDQWCTKGGGSLGVQTPPIIPKLSQIPRSLKNKSVTT